MSVRAEFMTPCRKLMYEGVVTPGNTRAQNTNKWKYKRYIDFLTKTHFNFGFSFVARCTLTCGRGREMCVAYCYTMLETVYMHRWDVKKKLYGS